MRAKSFSEFRYMGTVAVTCEMNLRLAGHATEGLGLAVSATPAQSADHFAKRNIPAKLGSRL